MTEAERMARSLAEVDPEIDDAIRHEVERQHSGIDNITLFDASAIACKTKFAGEVKGFDPTNYIDRKNARRMDRFAQFAVAAAKEALVSSGYQINDENRERMGIFIGSGIGGLTTLFEQTKILLEKGADRVSPFLVPMMISDMAAAQVSIQLGIKGECHQNRRIP